MRELGFSHSPGRSCLAADRGPFCSKNGEKGMVGSETFEK